MKTFIDSNVLIAAATGFSKISASAFAILNDPNREFVSSPFVRLETIPKAVFHRNKLNMGDALHVAAALLTHAGEFIPAERPTSPLKNVVGVKVISIYQR